MLTAEKIIHLLELKPLPVEGGYYRETYRSGSSLATAIYYLLTPDTFSALHRLRSDEIYHFYLGDPVEMLLLHADGSGKLIKLGTDLMKDMRPQFVVPGGVWQGSKLLTGGKFALLGTVMAPGFELSDYEAGNRKGLLETYGQYRDLVIALTQD